jgi:predicted PurR-regulated permease PerM
MADNFQPLNTPSALVKPGLLSTPSKINLVILCILLFIFAALMLTDYLTNIICMLAASLILTYILLGPVNFLESGILKLKIRQHALPHHLARALAILLVYLMFFSCLVISIFQVAPPLAAQIKEFARELPNYLSQFSETQADKKPSTKEPLAQLVQESLQKSSLQKREDSANTRLQGTRRSRGAINVTKPKTPLLKATYALALDQLIINYKNYASRLGSVILDIGSATLSSLIYGLTTLVLVFYLLHDGKEIQKKLINLVPVRHEASLERFLLRLHAQFHIIVKGQLLMSLLSGGLMYALLLLLGAKFALLLSVCFGLTSILPVIGPWIGLVPIVSLLAFSHPVDILQILMATGLFYIVKTYWIWPKLIRRKYDIHPILFTLSFVACLKLAGPLGILLSFPLASILGVLASTTKERHARLENTLVTEL